MEVLGSPGQVKGLVSASGSLIIGNGASPYLYNLVDGINIGIKITSPTEPTYVNQFIGSLPPGQPVNVSTKSFDINGYYPFTVNTVYTVQLFADLYEIAGGATAIVDPFFQFPAGYTLDLSPGIANLPAATPLPAALPLFATGLAGLGWLARRRHKQAA